MPSAATVRQLEEWLATFVWCRRRDELTDAGKISPPAIDLLSKWTLTDIFANKLPMDGGQFSIAVDGEPERTYNYSRFLAAISDIGLYVYLKCLMQGLLINGRWFGNKHSHQSVNVIALEIWDLYLALCLPCWLPFSESTTSINGWTYHSSLCLEDSPVTKGDTWAPNNQRTVNPRHDKGPTFVTDALNGALGTAEPLI